LQKKRDSFDFFGAGANQKNNGCLMRDGAAVIVMPDVAVYPKTVIRKK